MQSRPVLVGSIVVAIVVAVVVVTAAGAKARGKGQVTEWLFMCELWLSTSIPGS